MSVYFSHSSPPLFFSFLEGSRLITIRIDADPRCHHAGTLPLLLDVVRNCVTSHITFNLELKSLDDLVDTIFPPIETLYFCRLSVHSITDLEA